MGESPQQFSDLEACVDAIIDRVGKDIRLGLPLGLGKPIVLANALYQRACRDPSIKLHIATALSLEKPQGGQSLEKRFLEPFVQRLYGDIPDLAYVKDLRKGKVPDNVQISEFFFKAGSYLHNADQQQNYISVNYTHAVRDLMALGLNVVSQIVAPDPDGSEHISLSCNPDLSLDLLPRLRQQSEEIGRPVAVVAEINRNLPYLYHKAIIPRSDCDFILESPETGYPLFSAPNMNIAPADHLIGLYASTLIRDGGTLQVGIGSLGSAVVYSAVLRHTENDRYRRLLDKLQVQQKFPVAAEVGGVGTFEKGLYGCSEMMVDGFLHLYRAGILRREVFDDVTLQRLINEGRIGEKPSLEALDALREAGRVQSPLHARDVEWLKHFGFFRESVSYKGARLAVGNESIAPDLDSEESRKQIERDCLGERLLNGIVMHGGFFIGPADFYNGLRALSDAERRHIDMSSVNFINHLYDHPFGDQKLKRAQRKDARFMNSAMMYTLSGAAVSDGLDDGQVISGVGGQYNFVAMAHELPDGRSVMTLRSTHDNHGQVESNIVFNYAHCTIPRHLRDIVITEYGIADLRGRCDRDVYMALICIADSRFQEQLLKQAKQAGKVPADARIPEAYRNNTPASIQAVIAAEQADGFYQAFPFGCDFTDDELKLGKVLKALKAATATRYGLLKTLWGALRTNVGGDEFKALLDRMGLSAPKGMRAKLDRRLLVYALRHL